MCDRYELKTTARALLRHCPGLRLAGQAVPGGSEMRPGGTVWMLTKDGEGQVLSPARWGLVGSFLAHPPAQPPATLNSEGLIGKPFYGKLLQRHRCLLPATAFFAGPAAGGDARRQLRFSEARGKPLLLAGIFDHHPQAGTTCAILTAPAAATPGTIRGRLPFIVDPAESAFWLDDYADFPADDFAVLLLQSLPYALRSEVLPEPEISPQLSLAFA